MVAGKIGRRAVASSDGPLPKETPMNRALHLHPVSLALGLVLGGIAFLSMSQAIVVTSPLRIEYAPHPREMVTIRGGTPYVVPPGRVLVLTALGSTDGNAGAAFTVGLLVNGQREVTGFAGTGTVGQHLSDGTTMKAVPLGFTVAAGSTVEVVEIIGSQTPLAIRAWGYLAPQ